MGPGSVGIGFPRRGSRIPIYTGRRYISRRFDMRGSENSGGSQIKAEEKVAPSPTAPSQDVSQTESGEKPEEEGTLLRVIN